MYDQHVDRIGVDVVVDNQGRHWSTDCTVLDLHEPRYWDLTNRWNDATPTENPSIRIYSWVDGNSNGTDTIMRCIDGTVTTLPRVTDGTQQDDMGPTITASVWAG